MPKTLAIVVQPIVIVLAVLLGLAVSARAQTPLDRLDREIRGQGGPASQPAQPGDVPPAGQPSVTAPAAGRPAYLGAWADDQRDRGRGVRVLRVRPGGPAAAAGLRAQDLIVAAAGSRIRQMSDLVSAMQLMAAGDRLPLDIVRDGRAMKLEVTLGHLPEATEPRRIPGPEAVPAPPANRLPPGPAAPPFVPPSRPAEKPADGPSLPVPLKPVPPSAPEATTAAAATDRVEELQRRVDRLEKRVRELERELAEARKK
jgi:membrane-associated protease RseP (regulator of RpoE activity)